MVPFPALPQTVISLLVRLVAKIVTEDKGLIFMFGPGTFNLQIPGHPAVDSQNRVIFFPAHRHQYGDPSQSSTILKKKGVPVSLWRVYQSPLGYTHIMKAHIVIQHISACIGAFDMIGHFHRLQAALSTVGGPVDQGDIVLSFNFLNMSAFITQTYIGGIGKKHFIHPAFFGGGQFLIKLGQSNIGIPVNDKDTVIIEDQGVIMVKALKNMVLPGAGDALRPVHIGGPVIVAAENDIECTLMITKRCGPHPLSVNRFAAFQSAGFGFVQNIVEVVVNFPVYQIKGTQNDPTRHKVHGGTDHIIGIVYPDYIGIGEIG